MTQTLASGFAVGLIVTVTLLIGSIGFRISRTTSDFMVASRAVGPRMNASAIGGEYLSGASFLGVAALVFVAGAQMLWYPIGWTAGYLLLLVFVAAPLRRSGAYTLPDFAEARLGSSRVRLVCSLMVVVIGWLYLLPQFRGAGITLSVAVGAPSWVGPVIVALVVLAGVASGGMRSITLVQAFQYWFKLTALLLPAAVLLLVWLDDGRPEAPRPATGGFDLPVAGDGAVGLYVTYSLILATFLGTMGLPHVVVRFYTNPDGRAARRTTVTVLALLGAFYLLPTLYAGLARVYAGARTPGDALIIDLPGRMLDGPAAIACSALLVAGAFAAFLSTSSGLAVAVAGVITQDLTSRIPRLGEVGGFRLAALLTVSVALAASLATPGLGVARAVGLAFAVAAATFCPLLILGIWWRGLTEAGALAGLATGALGSAVAVGWALLDGSASGWSAALLEQPAAWTVPSAFAAAVLVSRATADRIPVHTARFLARLHLPEPSAARPGDERLSA